MWRSSRSSSLVALALIAALCAGPSLATEKRISAGAAPRFMLVDQYHRTVSDKDLATKPTLLHFGFTHCPVICPTTLFEVSEVMRELGPEADNYNFVFVTVDPERDTPDHLRRYLESFDTRIIGLSGAVGDIKALAADVDAQFSKRMLDSTSHTFDHSIYAFLLAKGWIRKGTLYMGTGARRSVIDDALKRLVASGN
jgi:protein SCO1